MTSLRSCTTVFSRIAPAVLAAMLVLSASGAFAQFGRGSYQRVWRQQAQAWQKQQQALEQQRKADYDAFMKRFDTNKNGKIDGKEKGPAQRYIREREMGIDPDKAINSLGRSTSTRSKRSSK